MMSTALASFVLADQTQTERLGAALAGALSPGLTVYLQGPLGAGKTTFVRGALRALGHSGAVKSPTYTLVESYTFDDSIVNGANPPSRGYAVHHFDLYRLADAEELEYMGIRDYFSMHSVCLIEWPNRGAGVLPEADLVVTLHPVTKHRVAELQAGTDLGETLLAKLSAAWECSGDPP